VLWWWWRGWRAFADDDDVNCGDLRLGVFGCHRFRFSDSLLVFHPCWRVFFSTVLCYMPFLLLRFLLCCLLLDSCYRIARLACAALSALSLRYIPGLPLIVPSRIRARVSYCIPSSVCIICIGFFTPALVTPQPLTRLHVFILASCLLLATYIIYLLWPLLITSQTKTHL